MKSLGVVGGISQELIQGLDRELSSEIARIYLAVKEDKEILVKRLKSLAFSVGLKAVATALTDNSIVDNITDIHVGYNVFKLAMQANKTWKKSQSYDKDVVTEEVDRLNALEFELDF
jgi:hypothetical protein|nr:MAG TPA: hypothetical protein [Caudoviricetes sp.]